jgi:hypothetical protein
MTWQNEIKKEYKKRFWKIENTTDFLKEARNLVLEIEDFEKALYSYMENITEQEKDKVEDFSKLLIRIAEDIRKELNLKR